MIFFKKENWNRFFTHKKKTTIRFHRIKEGLHTAGRGSRTYGNYKHLGKVFVGKPVEPEGKMMKDLTEQDAIDDGFDNLEELMKEIKRITFSDPKTPDSICWRYPINVVDGKKVI